jgi:hypothetical protein
MDLMTMRTWLWSHSTQPASAYCLRRSRAHVQVVVRAGSGRAGIVGASRCGSVWACPTCSQAIQGRREPVLREAVKCFVEPVMVTLTVRHTEDESLTEVMRRAQACWQKARSGKNRAVGEYARVMEVTYGRHGWHVHFHVLTESVSARRLVERWVAVAGDWASEGGQNIRAVDGDAAVSYLSRELLGSHFKGRSQWSLLARAVDGDGEALFRFGQFEDQIKGGRQLTFSRALQKAVRVLLPCADESDAEAVESATALQVVECEDGTVSTSDLVVCSVDQLAWAGLCDRGSLPAVLRLVDERDWVGLHALLARVAPSARLSAWASACVSHITATKAARERLF